MPSSIISPFPVFNDLDGSPLENGYIYIGQSNLNPETAPVNVFWDAARTIPAAQPIRTIGGFPSRNGSPSNVYVEADTYSITVRNSRRVFVYSAFDQSDAPSSVFDISTQVITATAGQTTFTLTTFTYLPGTDTLQVYRNGLRLTSGTDYLESNTSTVTMTTPAALGDEFLFQGGAVITGGNIPGTGVSFIQAGTGAIPRNMQDKAREIASVSDFGAAGNGSTDDTTAFNNAALLGRLTIIPKSTLGYNFPSPFIPKGAAWLPDPSMDWFNLTDSGNFSILKGTRQNLPESANIWRFADRVFISDAADKLTGNDTIQDNDANKSWFGNTINYAGYLGRNGKLVISSSPNYLAATGKDIPYGIAVGMRGSDTDQEVIGVGSHVVPTGSNGWGFIAELQREGDVQCIGIEIAAKNKGSYDTTQTTVSQTVGVFGLWLQGGGDSTFGGSPTYPSTAGVVFLKGSSTWNSGIVFLKNSLTSGRAMSLSSEGIGGNHYIEWQNAVGNSIFTITSTKTTATGPLQLQCNNNGIDIYQSGNSILSIGAPASNVNGLGIYGSATNVTPQIFAQGSDTNIDILLSPKGTGRVRFGTHVGTGDVACNGYIEIKGADGIIRKLMTTA